MQRVLIIQAELKHYRLPFFTGLCATLQRDGIAVTVAYSNSNELQALRKDAVDLPPPFGLRVRGRWFFHRFLYQPLWKQVFSSDLIIVGPEVKYLINPFLLVLSALRIKKVAFWGLGPNRHPNRSGLAEWLKERFFTRVDWWFAYTASIAEYMRRRGMPAHSITTVQNATDTLELRRLMQEISDDEVFAAQKALTGTSSSRIGLYCGLMGEIKELPLLLNAARLVKSKCPEFHLLLIGNGPERPWLERAVADEPWIHYLGSKYGRESALYYKMSDLFLLAGTAGLAVVDSFAAGLPFLATHLPTHPPEISYVADGENGRLSAHEAGAFADSILEVLLNPILMAKLRKGARESGSQYTMEAMIENFSLGIKRCLESRGAASPMDAGDLALPGVGN